jgi:hypothetical protein
VSSESAEQIRPEPEPLYAARPSTAWKRLSSLCLCWVPAFVGLIAWTWVAAGADPDPFIMFLLPLGFITAFVASVVIHELAHYTAIRLVRVKPLCFSIGHGPLLFHKYFNDGFALSIRAIPYSGYVLWSPLNQSPRWKHAVVTAAGPLANILVAAAALSLAVSDKDLWTILGMSDWMTVFMAILAFVNGMLLMLTLLPYHEEFATGKVPSDGLSLFNTLFRWEPRQYKPDWAEISEALKRAQTATAPADGSNVDSWFRIVNADDPNAFLLHHRELLDHSDMPADVRWQILDLFATAVLMFDAREYLADADRYSCELLRFRPNEWTVLGTRGSVLIELGRIDEGIAMLLSVVENDPKPFDQAIAAAYVALGELRKDNLHRAAHWIQKARAFDDSCVPMKRIEAHVAKAAASRRHLRPRS